MKSGHRAVGALMALAILISAQGWLAFHYVTIAPGRAYPAASLVHVKGKESPGNLLYVAVVTRRTNLIDLVRSWFDPLTEIRRARESRAHGGWRAYADAMRSRMEESRSVAAAVALRGATPGEGELFFAWAGSEWPLIEFEDTGVMGDSAGLMMALELYYRLTPNAMETDLLIAGTGALEPDGTVRPVDGIVQKVHAGQAAGAKVFLLPRANLAEVDSGAWSMRIIPVDTFEQALTALQRLAAHD